MGELAPRARLNDAIFFARLAAALWGVAAVVVFSVVFALGAPMWAGLIGFAGACVIGLIYWLLADRMRGSSRGAVIATLVLAWINLIHSVAAAVVLWVICMGGSNPDEARLMALTLMIASTAGLLLGRLVHHLGAALEELNRRNAVVHGFEPIVSQPSLAKAIGESAAPLTQS